MSDGFVWAAYLVTYGLILGYAATVWSRLRGRDDRHPDEGP